MNFVSRESVPNGARPGVAVTLLSTPKRQAGAGGQSTESGHLTTRSLEKTARIDLGLVELLRLAAQPGVPLDCHDIAAWCDCRWQNIQQIEQRGLRKLRNRLIFLKDERLREAAEQVLGRQVPL